VKFIYAPEDGPQQEWQFNPMRLMNVEAEMLEGVGGDFWDDYASAGQKLLSGNVRARRAFLWLFLRRNQPDLRFQDLAFRIDEVRIEVEDDDLTEPETPAAGKDETSDESMNGGSPTS
jgi:hypothetical protein